MIKKLTVMSLAGLVLMAGTPSVAEDEKAPPEPESPSQTEDQKSVEEAGERLKRILEQAAESGFVSLEDGEAAEVQEPNAENPRRRSLRGMARREIVQAEGEACIGRDLFIFSQEENTYSYERIFRIRNQMTVPGRDYTEKMITDLGITYVALALGEEAATIDDLLKSDRTELVAAMGKVIAGEPLGSNTTLLRASHCSENARLWLAMSRLQTDREKVLAEAEQHLPQLTALPPDLRHHFATQYGIVAAENGQMRVAARLWRIAEDAGDKGDPDFVYLQSLLDTIGSTPESLQALQRISAEQGPRQIEALLKIGELASAAGQLPYRDYIQDLELARSHYADTPMQDEAALLEIAFNIKNGSYAEAINRAKEQFTDKPSYLSRSRDTIAASIEQHFKGNSSMLRFAALDAYSYNIPFFIGYENLDNLKIAAAQTALYFDLPDLVLKILSDGPSGVPRDLMRARAHMALGAPQSAFALASSYEGNRQFHAVAADAAIAMDKPLLAIKHLDLLQQTPEVQSKKALSAWRAGEWASAEEQFAGLTEARAPQAGAYSTLASYMNGTSQALPPLDDRPLGDATQIRAQIENTEAEKELLKGVLNGG